MRKRFDAICGAEPRSSAVRFVFHPFAYFAIETRRDRVPESGMQIAERTLLKPASYPPVEQLRAPAR
ncbi:MAG TPA: hypothetical protein VF092_06695 [Longimicrobium sp.]